MGLSDTVLRDYLQIYYTKGGEIVGMGHQFKPHNDKLKDKIIITDFNPETTNYKVIIQEEEIVMQTYMCQQTIESIIEVCKIIKGDILENFLKILEFLEVTFVMTPNYTYQI